MAGQQEAPPHCFGNKWDANHPECKGGYDAAHRDPETGSHIREKCMWFEPCGAKQQAARMEPARQLLDPRSLVKNNVPVLAPARGPAPVNQVVERFAQSVAQQNQMVQYQQPQMMKAPPPQVAPPQAMYVQPQMMQVPQGYQQMMPVNYQMPGYLTVPEMRYPGENFFGFVLRTVFRSIGKSFGHSIAHLFDTVPLTPQIPPPSGSDSNGNGG